MKIVGIACSPRKDSNSSILLEECLGSLEKGEMAEVKRYSLIEMKFSPCIGCESCSKTGSCIYNDDLVPLFKDLLTADKIVLAAPVFAMGINALGKAMIDRTQFLWARQYVLKDLQYSAYKEGYFISTAGTTLRGVFDCAVRPAKYFMLMTGYKLSETLLANPVDKPGEVLEHSAFLEKARKLI